MAKLRITTNTGQIDVDGYLAVIKNLVQDANAFTAYESDATHRPSLLQAAAGANHVIRQQFVKADGSIAEEPITNNNCSIHGERDRLRVEGGPHRKSLVTVPLPDKPFPPTDPNNPTPFQYLDRYINEILNLYTSSFVPNTAASQEKARQFMFGMMLLTRCR